MQKKPHIETIDKYKVLVHGDIPQSIYPPPLGGYWNEMIPNFEPSSVLILGLGGGTIAQLIKEKYPKAKIVGVDNSKDILNLARKHFGIEALGVEIVERDAADYLKDTNDKFDFIAIDLWNGGWFWTWALSPQCLGDCQRIINPGGNIYINCPNLDQMAVNVGMKAKTDFQTNSIYKFSFISNED